MMKNIKIKAFAVAVGVLSTVMILGSTSTTFAQEKKKEEKKEEKKEDKKSFGQKVGDVANKTGKAIGKTATTVGHKTAEVAVKGTAKVVDKQYEGKVGPKGQTLYINSKNQKYYVNGKGGKVYVKERQIKNKPVEKK